MSVATDSRMRLRVRVEGTVQGVGFRPYVYRLAQELALDGFVRNDSHGVVIEVEGGERAVDRLLTRLAREAPPLAVLERVGTEPVRVTGERGFLIRESPRGGSADAPVAVDTATCEDCLRELLDPRDRRYRYAFTNCTNCGPRFTIVKGVPYDRPLTTMAGFQMCPSCEAEYGDPADRRFHAQPNACPECGPALTLIDRDGTPAELDGALDVIETAARELLAGSIIAVKGIGGFHLACRADDERAVSALRARKQREDKPFALMAASVDAAEELVVLGAQERALLRSPQRPIVLAPRRTGAAVASAVAPHSPELGVMLPYSPLHHLLLGDYAMHGGAALVMTSGNVSDEPIAFRDDEAVPRLGGIADLFLLHDRPIETRTDDSVLRVVEAPTPRAATLRRSRGYVPASLPLPGAGTARHLLACGAQLKNTFCLAKGERAWVGHHVGDLSNYETLRSFTEGIEHFKRLFAVAPAVVAHDLHPEYLSTKYALECDGVELVGVQHHHAHLAACLAEHGEPGRAVGAIFDGSGLGTDGTVWGGELLRGDVSRFDRIGTLWPVRLPGGERAIREPWRMACAWLAAATGEQAPALPAALEPHVERRIWGQIARLSRSSAAPVTSSMGRLFDAVSALCGICARASYEGQAAIELEAACDPSERGSYEIEIVERAGLMTFDPRAAVRAIAADAAAGMPPAKIASRFHRAVARVTVDACARAASDAATELVVLSGGVFQNRRLLEATAQGLARAGLRVLVPERLPANDGGISYGQAAVAASRIARR